MVIIHAGYARARCENYASSEARHNNEFHREDWRSGAYFKSRPGHRILWLSSVTSGKCRTTAASFPIHK